MNALERACLQRCWSEVRARGRHHFILRYGVVGFGLRVGTILWLTLFLAVPVLSSPESPDLTYIGSAEFWRSIVASAFVWTLAGYLWGAWEWSSREARFREAHGLE